MRRSISRLRPARQAELAERGEPYDTFRTSDEGPEFAFDPDAQRLGTGACRLVVETPDARLVPDAFLVLARLDDAADTRLLRLRPARNATGLRADFVVPDGYRLERFAPVVASELWRAGAVRLRRMSDAERQARTAVELARRWLASPRRLLSDSRRAAAALRRRDPRQLRLILADRLAETDAYPFDLFRDTVERRNRTLLAPEATPPVTAGDLTLVVPIYRTHRPWLEQLLDSLKAQTDPGCELVFVFDGPQTDLEAFVRDALAGRPDVVIETLPTNRGVSAACNAGFARAGGRYVAVIDHDDRLDRNFVAAFRQAMRTAPADIYFADEAITDAGMRVVRGVATRGRFDRRFYLSHPYIVHPIVFRRSVAEKAGGFDETLSVSHDIDFFLRCLAHARSVVQIPLVLYYWRTHAGSLGHQAADRVGRNTKAAIERFLRSTTDWTGAEVRDGPTFNTYEVRPPAAADAARVAIVIPTRNNGALLASCLASIERRRAANRAGADVFVVDHRSDEPETLAFLAEARATGRIEVVRVEGPWNYAAINNRAVAAAISKRPFSHLVLMNNDVELVTEDWLDRLLAPFAYGDVGVVGCCLAYPDRRVQHAGVVLGLAGAAEHAHKFEPVFEGGGRRRRAGHLCGLTATRDCSAVTGALLAVPSDVFAAAGGFDESLAVGFNDVDLCLRIGERGMATTYVGGALAIHHESASRPDRRHPDDTRRFRERWGSTIERGDEHYGLMMDWSSPAAAVCLKRQKPFALRRTEIGAHARPGRDEEPSS